MRIGQKTTIQCVVEGFQQSEIHWEADIDENAYRYESSLSKQKRKFTKESIFTIDSPTSAYDGKKVYCVVEPKHGDSIQTQFILSYEHGM